MPIESSLGIPNIALALGVSSWRCAHRQSSNHHAQGTRHCLQWRFLAILDNPKSPPNLKTNFRNSATAYFPTLCFDGSTAAIESPVWTSVALNTVLFGRSFSVAMNEKSIWITGCRPFRLRLPFDLTQCSSKLSQFVQSPFTLRGSKGSPGSLSILHFRPQSPAQHSHRH